MIYADNAATTRLSSAAREAMLPYLDSLYGNPSSLHAAGREARAALETARERVASCMGAAPEDKNSFEEPRKVIPRPTEVVRRGEKITVEMPPFSMLMLLCK